MLSFLFRYLDSNQTVSLKKLMDEDSSPALIKVTSEKGKFNERGSTSQVHNRIAILNKGKESTFNGVLH